MFSKAGSSGVERIHRLDEARPEPVPEHGLDLVVDPVADGRIVRRVLDHVLADDANAHAGQRPRAFVGGLFDDMAGVRFAGNQGLRHRGVDVPGIEVAELGIPKGIQDEGRVADGAAVDACAVHQRVRADGSAVRDQALGREQAHHAVPRRRTLAGASGLLAEGARGEVRRHRDARPGTRAPRRALRVIRVAGLPAPRAPFRVAQVAGGRGGRPAGIADAAVELGRVRLGVDDGALLPQPVDDRGIGGWCVHGEVDVRRRRGPHVLRVEDVLEGHGDAVHRERGQVGVSAVQRVQLDRPLEGVRLLPEGLAGGGAVRGELPRRGMLVAGALAGHGALAAQVQRAERVHLPRAGDAGHHAVLRLHVGIGERGLHAPQVQRDAGVTVEVRKDARQRHGGRGEADRRPGANRTARRGHRRAVDGDELRARAVVGPGPVDVGLHHALASDSAALDRAVDPLDGRLLDPEGPGRARLGLRDGDCRQEQKHGPNP